MNIEIVLSLLLLLSKVSYLLRIVLVPNNLVLSLSSSGRIDALQVQHGSP